MNILGNALHWPSNKDLAFTAGLTVGWAIVFIFLNNAGIVENEAVPVSTSAVLVGSLAHGCGVSIVKNGWRAIALLSVLLGVLMVLLKIAGIK